MIRTIIYLLVTIVVIALLRGVIGIIAKAFTALFEGEAGAASGQPGRPSSKGMGGELVKDPVCGVYVAPSAAVKKMVRGQTYHFCSEACRDKFS